MKIWNYIFLAITMIFFFQLIGWTGISISPIQEYTGTNMTQVDGHIQVGGFDVSGSGFKTYLFDIFIATLAGLGIAAGLYFSGSQEIALRAAIAPAIFVGFIPAMYIPITKGIELGVSSWAMGILLVIFGTFAIGFLIALIEWVLGGSD